RRGRIDRPVLALSSGGGHWIELLRLRPAWEGLDVVYATVHAESSTDVGPAPLFAIPDGNLHTVLRLPRVCGAVFLLVMRIRPRAIVSTGAAPGFFALFFGKLIGAKTVWVDSIANADQLSLSGKAVRPFADAWLTQWDHIASDRGPHCYGSVL
ncbi:MAG: UDP-N-acetylglucosamine--LPS N-acetylglucosamine transferase, partial [Spirochaetota bacterium]